MENPASAGFFLCLSARREKLFLRPDIYMEYAKSINSRINNSIGGSVIRISPIIVMLRLSP